MPLALARGFRVDRAVARGWWVKIVKHSDGVHYSSTSVIIDSSSFSSVEALAVGRWVRFFLGARAGAVEAGLAVVARDLLVFGPGVARLPASCLAFVSSHSSL